MEIVCICGFIFTVLTFGLYKCKKCGTDISVSQPTFNPKTKTKEN